MTVRERFAIAGEFPVLRLGFGAMRITGNGIWGEPGDPAGARAVLRRVIDLGVNLIDTADSYGPEVSERLIADTLRPYPAHLAIATKGGFDRPGPGAWRPNGRPEHLRAACEGSLRRLRLERIALYQLHTVDPRVAFEESVGALAELRAEGKVRHVGLSNVSVEQIDRARTIVPIASVQNRFSLSDRSSEAVLRRCAELGIAFICWAPLDRGALGRRSIVRSARAHDATPAQVALAWVLQRAPVAIPIPSTGSIEHLDENVRALAVELTAEEIKALEHFRRPVADVVRRAAAKGGRGAGKLSRRIRRARP
jgi:aryl-alcohol dehydrogenase-like predicted oxidoreductase